MTCLQLPNSAQDDEESLERVKDRDAEALHCLRISGTALDLAREPRYLYQGVMHNISGTINHALSYSVSLCPCTPVDPLPEDYLRPPPLVLILNLSSLLHKLSNTKQPSENHRLTSNHTFQPEYIITTTISDH